MKENKNIPFKNYIVLSCILILSIIIIMYFYMWYGEIKMNKINTTIMDDYLSIINYNELETYLIENKNAFIYVSISDQTVRNFEEKFGKIINKYSLNDNMLYLNLTEEYKDNKLFNNIKKNYKLEGKSCIISFKDGLVDDVYSIDNHNYDLELLTSYLKIKGVIYD